MLPEYMLSQLFAHAAELGATAALSKAGLIKPTMCKQEASRIYGRAQVERWIKAGKIKKAKDDRWRIDRVMIQALHMEQTPIYKAILKRL